MRKDILDFVSEDDRQLLERKQIEEARIQTELLRELLRTQEGGLNNHQVTIKVDMSVAHTDEEVWHSDGSFRANTLTSHAVDVEYWYGLNYGDRVRVPAGLIVEVSGHEIERLYITNTETLEGEVLEITIAGRLV